MARKINMHINELFNLMGQELSERQGVPEHPKLAAKRRERTEERHFGKAAVHKAKKMAERMKSEPKITNAFALSKWMTLPKFAKARKAAHEKAARTRAKRY
jgi:hypothetical protein